MNFPNSKPSAGGPSRWTRIVVKGSTIIILGLLPAVGASGATDPGLMLERTEDFLRRTGISFLADLEGYYIDQRPGGLLFSEKSFLNPRLSMFFERNLGNHFYVFLQARADRGFDPKVKNSDIRLDEYLLRWKPFDGSQLHLQAGQFATVVGNWVTRHDSWNNPFITAPLPYENAMTITDHTAPGTPGGFLARRNVMESPTQKGMWLPILWGPSYASGASLFGSLGKVDYAVEIKNASISSRPTSWGVDELTWRFPTTSARLGYRPSEAWTHGISFSYGTYLLPEAEPALPVGRKLTDYNQITLGYDVSYAWHKWQVWGEVFMSRFQVPNVGNADTLAYYLEAKYKFNSHLFGALRWNQQFFGTVPDGLGGRQTWDHNNERVDACLGYRFNRYLQGKLQYSISHQNATWQKGEQLLAAQLTLKL